MMHVTTNKVESKFIFEEQHWHIHLSTSMKYATGPRHGKHIWTHGNLLEPTQPDFDGEKPFSLGLDLIQAFPRCKSGFMTVWDY